MAHVLRSERRSYHGTAKTGDNPDLKLVNPNAAAIDIGSTMHVAAVNPDVHACPVRAFRTYTQDLQNLADWFQSCGVTTVAMESMVEYWIPAFEILEAYGFDVILVNTRYAKNVPGRKTDISDASWLRQLHSYGLLRDGFRPETEVCNPACIHVPARTAEGVCGRQYTAHAEGPDGDEPATSSYRL